MWFVRLPGFGGASSAPIGRSAHCILFWRLSRLCHNWCFKSVSCGQTPLSWGHSDLWPPKSDQFNLEYKWVFEPKLEFFVGLGDITWHRGIKTVLGKLLTSPTLSEMGLRYKSISIPPGTIYINVPLQLIIEPLELQKGTLCSEALKGTCWVSQQ